MVSSPIVTPVTMPLGVTVALALLLLHTPPAVASLSVINAPVHTTEEPVMLPADGGPLTVTVAVTADVPQLPLIV